MGNWGCNTYKWSYNPTCNWWRGPPCMSYTRSWHLTKMDPIMRPFWKPWNCDLQWFGIHLGRKARKISMFFQFTFYGSLSANLRNEHERTHHRWWYSFSNFQLLKKKRSAGVDSLPFSLPVLAEHQITFHGRNKLTSPKLAKSVSTTKSICLAKSCGNPSPDKHGYKLEYCPGTFKT